MRLRWILCATAFLLCLSAGMARADQLILKNGREYSGKLVRADAYIIEFRVLGRVETFKTSEVAQIVFREPEMVNPPVGRTMSSIPEAGEPARQVPPERPPVDPDLQPTATSRQNSNLPGPAASVTLPAGTTLTIRMMDSVDTDKNHVGDSFQATLQEPLSLGSQVVVPRGAEVRGNVAYSKESGRATGQTELILELSQIRFGGRSYNIQTSDYSEVGVSRGKRTAAAAGGVAAVGAIIGAIAGGGKGAAVGAATGAAVGTGAAVLSKGQTIKVPAETILDFKLQKPLTVDVP